MYKLITLLSSWVTAFSFNNNCKPRAPTFLHWFDVTTLLRRRGIQYANKYWIVCFNWITTQTFYTDRCYNRQILQVTEKCWWRRRGIRVSKTCDRSIQFLRQMLQMKIGQRRMYFPMSSRPHKTQCPSSLPLVYSAHVLFSLEDFLLILNAEIETSILTLQWN